MHYAVATSIIPVIARRARRQPNIMRHGQHATGHGARSCYVLGAVAGGVSAGWLAASVLEGFFGFVLLPTAWVMWHGKQAELGATGEVKRRTQSTVPPSARDIREAGGKLGGSYLDESDERVVCYGVRRLPAGLAISPWPAASPPAGDWWRRLQGAALIVMGNLIRRRRHVELHDWRDGRGERPLYAAGRCGPAHGRHGCRSCRRLGDCPRQPPHPRPPREGSSPCCCSPWPCKCCTGPGLNGRKDGSADARIAVGRFVRWTLLSGWH